MPVGLSCRFRQRSVALGALAVALSVALGVTGASVAAAGPAPHPATTVARSQGSTFTAMPPTRVLDTRYGIGTGGSTGPVGANGYLGLDLSSIVPSTATAVVLNVTATDTTAGTYVTVYPSGSAMPLASNLNLVAGETRPNLVTVALNPSRNVTLYNFAGSVDLIADVAGYYSSDQSGSDFTSVSPTRVLDTRNGNGPVGPNGTVTVDLSGQVPAGTTAVTFNLTATDVTDGTYVTAYPDTLGSPPSASNLNVVGGETRANLVTVQLGADRKVTLYNFAGSVDLVADLAGYYAPGQGQPFYSLAPYRALDTRDFNGNSTANTLGPNGTRVLDLSAWLPSSATAVVFNFTGTNTTTGTYLSAYPDGTPRPTASNVNLTGNQTAPNLTTVTIGGDHKIDLYNLSGNTDVLVDLAGYFATPVAPCGQNCIDAWGSNGRFGQLADGSSGNWSPTPSAVAGLSGVTQVSGGETGGVALRSDGTVWAWGLENGLGTANGTTAGFAPVPVQVSGLSGIVTVAGDDQDGYALGGDGTLWAWGADTDDQLGDGMPGSGTLTPEKVPGMTGVTAIAATGLNAYAVKSDGTVWAWGAEFSGALGNGTNGSQSSPPVQVTGLTGVVGIAAGGNREEVVKSDGTVWEWGQESANNTVDTTPVQVSGLSGITKVAAGYSALYALRGSDGTVWAWGWNESGELGNGTETSSETPTQVSGLTGVTAIAAGFSTGTAVKSDGTVWTWGYGEFGELGSNVSAADSHTDVPVQVPGLSGITSVSTGGNLNDGGTQYALGPATS